MRFPEIERRSHRYAARQYVSDYEEGPEMSAAIERARGVVKFFNTEKGFGFCRRDNGQPDVFIHANALKRSGIMDAVRPGDTLEFDIEVVAGKGPKADNILVVMRAPNGSGNG